MLKYYLHGPAVRDAEIVRLCAAGWKLDATLLEFATKHGLPALSREQDEREANASILAALNATRSVGKA